MVCHDALKVYLLIHIIKHDVSKLGTYELQKSDIVDQYLI